MATHNIHSEVVYRYDGNCLLLFIHCWRQPASFSPPRLSPNRNITQSFRTFGLECLDGHDCGYLLLFNALPDALDGLTALLGLTLHQEHAPHSTADTQAIRKVRVYYCYYKNYYAFFVSFRFCTFEFVFDIHSQLYSVTEVEAPEGNQAALLDSVVTRIATKGL
jgi:hypothetical protein